MDDVILSSDVTVVSANDVDVSVGTVALLVTVTTDVLTLVESTTDSVVGVVLVDVVDCVVLSSVVLDSTVTSLVDASADGVVADGVLTVVLAGLSLIHI